VAPVKSRYAYVVLAALILAMTAVNVLFTVSYYHREQASQQHQGQMLEQKLCSSLDKQAELKPPGGSPANNPSRAYLQQQHAVLAELGPDVGCPS
jgi:hypothetical protein